MSKELLPPKTPKPRKVPPPPSKEEKDEVLRVIIQLVEQRLGHAAQARDFYQKALNIWKEQGNLSSQASLLNNLGFLHQQLGEYEQAVHALEEGLLCARQSGFKRMEALISLSLGDVYSDVEDFGQTKQPSCH